MLRFVVVMMVQPVTATCGHSFWCVSISTYSMMVFYVVASGMLMSYFVYVYYY